MGPAAAAAGDELTSWEPKLKRPKEEILDGPQVSSLDFFKIGPVSTSLGLSLENPNLIFSSSSASGDSSVAMDGAFDRALERMDAEMDSFIKLQVSILLSLNCDLFMSRDLANLCLLLALCQLISIL